VVTDKCACGGPAHFMLSNGSSYCGKVDCIKKKKVDANKWLDLAAPSDRPTRQIVTTEAEISAEEEAALYEFGWGMGGEDYRLGRRQPGQHHHGRNVN
jgi:hypothetical protein